MVPDSCEIVWIRRDRPVNRDLNATMKPRSFIWILAFVGFAAIGYWLAGTAAPDSPVRERRPSQHSSLPRNPMPDEPPVKFRASERDGETNDPDALAAGAFQGERILLFADAAALERFLARADGLVRILDRLDALHALRIGFDDPMSLRGLLDEDAIESFVFPVMTPPPPEGTVQADAVALGARLREWLGITGNNSDWGAGVLIAILDTGVQDHSTFAHSIRTLDLLGGSDDGSGSHGTAVASILSGNDPLAPGVAPGANLLSIRIADADGYSDSFLLARGIIEAANAGAALINISMGSHGDSALVRNAIRYAIESGALIIASVGNNGIQQVSYPAANDGVIGVGAVDATGNHLLFSNTGQQVDIAAPGFGLNAAWAGDELAHVSGTSFSAPVVTGAIAAIMTQYRSEGLTAAQAWEVLNAYLNDGGAAGEDPELGSGMPDVGRVLDSLTPGLHDAAVASQRIIPPTPATPFGEVEILIQNRGTEPLINTAVHISMGGGTTTSNITILPPNAVRTVRVPIPGPPALNNGNVRVDSSVSLSSARDVKPANDRRVETLVVDPAR